MVSTLLREEVRTCPLNRWRLPPCAVPASPAAPSDFRGQPTARSCIAAPGFCVRQVSDGWRARARHGAAAERRVRADLRCAACMYAPGNHDAAGPRTRVNASGVDRRIDDLTEEGARRVLSGPEIAGVLVDLLATPQRAAAILLRRTDLLKVILLARRPPRKARPFRYNFSGPARAPPGPALERARRGLVRRPPLLRGARPQPGPQPRGGSRRPPRAPRPVRDQRPDGARARLGGV